jgi:membrane protease YdiL (CAAX protease family)
MTTSRMRTADDAAQDASSPRLLSHPLEALVFLLPLLIIYEVGCLWLDTDTFAASQERVVAFHLLQVFFQLFGSTGIWMPGAAVVVILFCTHVASRRPWRIRTQSVGLMYAEALALAFPLIALNYVCRITPLQTGTGEHLLADVVLGIGAGIYEELVFRLMAISLLVMLGTDFLNLPRRFTLVVAVILSSLAFAAHHHPPLGSEPFDAGAFIFRSLAGGISAPSSSTADTDPPPAPTPPTICSSRCYAENRLMNCPVDPALTRIRRWFAPPRRYRLPRSRRHRRPRQRC